VYGESGRLALVVEGGGMRGVLSAGALLALDVLGYRECFDAVFATSAGSVNAAYFLSNQGELGIRVYFEDLNDLRFFNPLRFWKILDVDYVYDEVVQRSKPLDQAAVHSARAAFFVTMTNAVTGENVLHDVSHSREPIPKLLKASSALPVLYNRTVHIGSDDYVDGGVSGGPPLDWAFSRGFSNVLYLSTRAENWMSEPPSWYEKMFFYLGIGRRFPALMQAYCRAYQRKQRIHRLAAGLDTPMGVNVATFHADARQFGLNRTTTARGVLLKGARSSALAMCNLLQGDPASIECVFERFEAKGR
jgi:predicted patatin/cPLA2 family phospholipase